MKNKLSSNVVKKMLRDCNIPLDPFAKPYDLDIYFAKRHWESGYESGHGYDGIRREYYEDQGEMIDFLFEFLKSIDASRCIIAPFGNYSYFKNWSDIHENDIYRIMKSYLKEANIRTNSQFGMELDIFNESDVLKAFIEGGFRYISQAVFLFPEHCFTVEPHHHMNYMINMSEHSVSKEKIKEVVSRYASLATAL